MTAYPDCTSRRLTKKGVATSYCDSDDDLMMFGEIFREINITFVDDMNFRIRISIRDRRSDDGREGEECREDRRDR